jgi:hypothetical protein
VCPTPAQGIDDRRRHREHVDGTIVTNQPVFILIYGAAFVLIQSPAQHPAPPEAPSQKTIRGTSNH